jgi:hypothetical protein
MVRCLFRVVEKTYRAGTPELVEVRLSGVADAVFGPWTPSADMRLSVVPSAAELLELNGLYTVDFTRADEPPAPVTASR